MDPARRAIAGSVVPWARAGRTTSAARPGTHARNRTVGGVARTWQATGPAGAMAVSPAATTTDRH